MWGRHIPAERKDSHAKMLMAGSKSNLDGTECVISNFQDLYPIVMYFNQFYSMEGDKCLENSRFAGASESVTSAFKEVLDF